MSTLLLVKLDPEEVASIFKAAVKQHDYLVALYAKVVPDWDRVESVKKYPVVSRDTWHKICQLAMQWDRVNAPGAMPGGGWMNSGFSTSPEDGQLALWEVSVDVDGIDYLP